MLDDVLDELAHPVVRLEQVRVLQRDVPGFRELRSIADALIAPKDTRDSDKQGKQPEQPPARHQQV